jgi:hypothetical protein
MFFAPRSRRGALMRRRDVGRHRNWRRAGPRGQGGAGRGGPSGPDAVLEGWSALSSPERQGDASGFPASGLRRVRARRPAGGGLARPGLVYERRGRAKALKVVRPVRAVEAEARGQGSKAPGAGRGGPQGGSLTLPRCLRRRSAERRRAEFASRAPLRSRDYGRATGRRAPQRAGRSGARSKPRLTRSSVTPALQPISAA